MNTPKGKALIIDSESTHQLLETILAEMGFKCFIAQGDTDLSNFTAEAFQIIFIRVDMPEVSGYEVLKYLKENYLRVGHKSKNIQNRFNCA